METGVTAGLFMLIVGVVLLAYFGLPARNVEKKYGRKLDRLDAVLSEGTSWLGVALTIIGAILLIPTITN